MIMTVINVLVLVSMLVFALMLGPANAQQNTPSQTAIQIDNVINAWAQQIEALQRENAELRKQIEDVKAKTPEDKK